jgi:hypothetical protein
MAPVTRGRQGSCSQKSENKETGMKLTVELQLKKSTKGTHVYENPDKGLTGMYFPKVLFGDDAEKPPQTVKLTLEGK